MSSGHFCWSTRAAVIELTRRYIISILCVCNNADLPTASWLINTTLAAFSLREYCYNGVTVIIITDR